MSWLATIGYEGASFEDFLATLRQVGVDSLIDIRQVPISRRAGYSKNQLRAAVEADGIRYLHLVGLGDPKEGRDAARQGRYAEFRHIFTCHLQSVEARADLDTAAGIAEKGGMCLLCYERQPEFCHRSMVADALAHRIGVDILHLDVTAGLAIVDRDERTRTRVGAGQGVAACR